MHYCFIDVKHSHFPCPVTTGPVGSCHLRFCGFNNDSLPDMGNAVVRIKAHSESFAFWNARRALSFWVIKHTCKKSLFFSGVATDVLFWVRLLWKQKANQQDLRQMAEAEYKGICTCAFPSALVPIIFCQASTGWNRIYAMRSFFCKTCLDIVLKCA